MRIRGEATKELLAADTDAYLKTILSARIVLMKSFQAVDGKDSSP
jgi:hypothetical protein